MVTQESFVIDANIINALHRAYAGLPCEVTDDPLGVLELIATSGHRVVLDEGGHIQQEWQNCVDEEWFGDWFLTFASSANVVIIPTGAHPALERKLRVDCGFPKRENVWLVRTARTEALDAGACNLLSEDMDFRDPTKKKAPETTRAAYLRGTKVGPVTKELKKVSIFVLSLAQY